MKGRKDGEGTGASLTCEEGVGAGAAQPGREKVWEGHVTSVCKCLKGGCREHGTRLFSVVHSDRTRGNGHKHRHCRIYEVPHGRKE